MDITIECPDCGARITVGDALAKIIAKARANYSAAIANEADAAKELDRTRSETAKASAELTALLSLATTLETP